MNKTKAETNSLGAYLYLVTYFPDAIIELLHGTTYIELRIGIQNDRYNIKAIKDQILDTVIAGTTNNTIYDERNNMYSLSFTWYTL